MMVYIIVEGKKEHRFQRNRKPKSDSPKKITKNQNHINGGQQLC